jgi:hypothetical protein
MDSQGKGAEAQAIQEALTFLQETAGRRALVELSYGEWVLARFQMQIEESEAAEGLLTVIGDVHEMGEALLYSEVNLPLSQSGVYEISVAGGEMRLSSDDGMRLHVTRI